MSLQPNVSEDDTLESMLLWRLKDVAGFQLFRFRRRRRTGGSRQQEDEGGRFGATCLPGAPCGRFPGAGCWGQGGRQGFGPGWMPPGAEVPGAEVDRADGSELLVPMVRDAIRSIDVAARRIDVDMGFLAG